MTSKEELEPVYQKALDIMDAREPIYGRSWQKNRNTCLNEVNRKATYLQVQREKGHVHTSRFKEDLLDLMNWAAGAYWHIDKETKNEISS